jgi:hypothetical protein
MPITIKWRDGREELLPGGTIRYSSHGLMIFAGRTADADPRHAEPDQVIPLADFAWARSETGRFVGGSGVGRKPPT